MQKPQWDGGNKDPPPPFPFSFPSQNNNYLKLGFGYLYMPQTNELMVTFIDRCIYTMIYHDKTTKDNHFPPPTPPKMVQICLLENFETVIFYKINIVVFLVFYFFVIYM